MAGPHEDPGDPPVQGPSARILLAEPNPLVSAIATRGLADCGHDVERVSTAEAALEALDGGDFDILITVWELDGDLNGAELCRRVREQVHLDRLRIIVLTSHDDDEHILAAFDAGADDFVAKPFHIEVFLARVRASLRMLLLERDHFSALESLRRREAAYKEIAAEQAALRRVTVSVAEAATPEDVFGLVAREVARVLGCEGGLVVKNDSDGFLVMGRYVARGVDAPQPGERLMDGQCSIVGRVAQGEAVVDVSEPGSGGLWHARAGAPVHVEGALWGSVIVMSTDATALPPDSDQRTARFADLVSLAIGNAQARKEIAEMAVHDPLTGMLNRRAFDTAFDQLVAYWRRNGEPVSLVIFDIDRFKRVNDDYGHEVGDMVLTEVGARLNSTACTEEPVYRLGGEEFAWLLKGVTATEALHAAERARAAVALTPFVEVGTVTVSAGICDILAAGDPELLFQAADAALYRAKEEGRDRCMVAIPTGAASI